MAGQDPAERVAAAFDKAVAEFQAADTDKDAWAQGYSQAIQDMEEYVAMLQRITDQMRSHMHRKFYRHQRERK